MVALWAVRLTVHLLYRNHCKRSGEDPRYMRLRSRYRQGFWWKALFVVFLPQAIAQFAVGVPLLLAMQSEPPASQTTPKNSRDGVVFDLFGVATFAVGFLIETFADLQLSRFTANQENAGRLCTTGLWGLSRHPNYFGEALVWWGFWFLASHSSAVWPGGLLTVFSPIVMTYAVRYVTGVPEVETAAFRKRSGYEEWARNTPIFLPALAKIFQ